MSEMTQKEDLEWEIWAEDQSTEDTENGLPREDENQRFMIIWNLLSYEKGFHWFFKPSVDEVGIIKRL